MEFRQSSPEDTLSVEPSRRFLFIIDPETLPFYNSFTYSSILKLVSDLENWDPAIEIRLLVPTYLAGPHTRSLADHAKPPFRRLTAPPSGNPFSLDPDIPGAIRARLLNDDLESKNDLSLLALADISQADGIVTSSNLLVEARYSVYQHHQIRIVPLEELADAVEVFCHGHSLFWSASNPNRRLVVDIFYQWTHWKNSRLLNWANKFLPTLSSEDLQAHLRSALFKRYSFVLYARDHIRFYEFQRDYFSRRGLSQRFSGPVGYHVVTFYFLLWGVLEELTLIAKYKKGLTLPDKDCGIANPKFWAELGSKEPGLKKFIQTDPIAEWISLMADMRHLAAHDAIPTPTTLVKETKESQKSEEEILKEIREEYADFYSLLPPELMREMEPFLVSTWRTKKMKVVAEGMVVIDRKGRGYLRNPVVSVDYDLAMLNAVIDAFIVKLFSS